MFEALGCGKPFVGTNVGGVPNVIISDTYGLLARPSDAGDLAEKILIALDHTWDREEIVRYADHFTWEEISKEIMKVYHSVL
jgi:glycosyltransferase involved in cell wall biosynthesis